MFSRFLIRAAMALALASPAYALPPSTPAPFSAALLPPVLDLSPTGQYSATRPFVIVLDGQSNGQSEAPCAGDANGNAAYAGCTVGSNIWIWNAVWGSTDPTGTSPAPSYHAGTAMIPAVFGTPPLAGYSLVSATGYNNAAVQAANRVRASGLISPSRPIWIIPNWYPGHQLYQWIGSGTSSPDFANLVTSLNGAAAAYGKSDFAIDLVMRMQGEGDYNGSGTPNSLFSTYQSGIINTLIPQYKALSYWKPWTKLTFQELRTWGQSSDRNDVFWWLKSNYDDPNVDVISSSCLTDMFSPSGNPTLNRQHFDAPSITTIGNRTADAFLRMAFGHGKEFSGTRGCGGDIQAPPKTLSYGNGSSRSAVTLNVDDLRNGAVISAVNTDFTLPDPANLPGSAAISIHAYSQTGGNVTLTSASALFYFATPAGTPTPSLTTINLNDNKETVTIQPVNGVWQVVADSSRLFGDWAIGGTLTPTGGPATYTLSPAQIAAHAAYDVAPGQIILPAPISVQRGQVCLVTDAGTPVTLATVSGSSIVDWQGTTIAGPTYLPLVGGRWYCFTAKGSFWWAIGGDPTYQTKSGRIVPASGSSMGLPMQGTVAVSPAAGIAALTINTPNPALDGAVISVMFTQGVGTLTINPTATGGVTPTLAGAPSSVAAGQWLLFSYNAFAATWYVKAL